MTTSLLDAVSHDLARLSNSDHIMQVTGAKIAAYLGAARVFFLEVDPAEGVASVLYDWSQPDLPSGRLVYRIADFVDDSFLRTLAASESFVIRDTMNDPRTAGGVGSYAALRIGASLNIPYISDGQLKFLLAVQHETPYDWQPDQLDLMRELTARLWLAIERGRALEALRESEARLRLALEAAQAGIFDLDPRPDSRPVVTEGVKRLFGFAPDEQPTMDEYVGRVHPEDRERVAGVIQGSLDNGVGHYIEYRVVHLNGEERWLASRAEAPPGEDGRARRLVGVVIDITERKQAEVERQRVLDEVSRQKSLFEGVLSSVQDYVYVFDHDACFVYANPKLLKLWGLTAAEAVGKTMPELDYPPEVERQLRSDVAEVIRTGALVSSVTHYTSPTGVEGYFENFLAPVLSPQGDVALIAGVSRDITDRKRVEEALRDADRLKDEFLATLAHELRNPLAPIRNAVQILNLKGSPTPTAQAARDVIDRQVTHMVRLIDDLLDVSRITRGKLDLRQERVELAAVIEQALETSRPLIEAAGHDLLVSPPAEPVPLHGDPVRLAQVFSNLLNNAAKYTEGRGKIWLTAQREGDDVVVKVRDTGKGIELDSLDAIFEMFTQVDRSLDRGPGGLGIGLTLVKRLVELHGGTVTAFSEGPGRGSEFTVRLPILSEAPAAPVEDVTPALTPNGAAPAGRRILIVEDNVDIADTLVTLLAMEGHVTYTACDGLAGLAAAEQYQPDVILLDIGLPKLDGFEVCRRIREQPWGQAIALVALTGWGQAEDRRKSKEAGFDYHLVKPVDYDDLMNALAALPYHQHSR